MRQLKEMAGVCDLSIELNPKHAFYYGVRALVKTAKGDLEGAMIDLNRGIEISPKFLGAYVNRGDVKIRLRDFDGAIVDSD